MKSRRRKNTRKKANFLGGLKNEFNFLKKNANLKNWISTSTKKTAAFGWVHFLRQAFKLEKWWNLKKGSKGMIEWTRLTGTLASQKIWKNSITFPPGSCSVPLLPELFRVN